MRRMKPLLVCLAVTITAMLAAPAKSQPPKKEAAGELTIVDANGKEHKLKTWKFIAGITNLSWLVPAKQDPARQDQEFEVQKGGKGGKQPPPVKEGPGPQAFVFAEGSGAPLKKGVMTYILVENIRRIDFDPKKDEATVHVARSDKEADDVELKGVTGYVATNVLTIEVREDLGELGQRVTEFKGGVKNGVQSIRFPSPKPAPALAKDTKPYIVTTADKAKSTFPVFDMQGLYRGGDGLLQALPNLYFKETVKIDLGKVKNLTRSGGQACDVTLTDGRSIPALVLLPGPPEGKAQLDGLVARVPAGWKVVPLPLVSEINAGAVKKNIKDL